MALTIAITDLLTDINFVAGAGDNISLINRMVGPSLDSGAYREVWHEPDYGEARLIRLEDGDKLFSAELIVDPDTAGDMDDVLNKIATLKRWIHGAGSQAVRAERREPVRDIYLKLQLDGTTNATLHRIKTAAIPNMDAVLGTIAQNSKRAWKLQVDLRLAPYGRAQYPLYIHNALTSSPHFLHDSNSDGLADGWSLINGAETATPSLAARLIGERSQSIITTTSGHGVKSDDATVPANHLMIGSVWLRIASGTVGVYIRQTGGTAISSTTGLTSGNIASNAEQTLTDRHGNSWYLIKVEQLSGELATETDVYLSVEDESGGASFTVDGAQLMTIRAANFHDYPGMDVEDTIEGDWVRGWTTDNKIDFSYSLVNTDYFVNDALNTSWQFNHISNFNALEAESRVYPLNRGSSLKASGWVKLSNYSPPTDQVDVKLELLDGAGSVIDSVTITESDQSNAEASATGDDGGTWYQLVVEGTNSDARDVQIRFTLTPNSGGGTGQSVHIDEVYIYETERFTFDNWMIYGERIYNRNDYSAANPQRVNTLDFFNIPGDAPALLVMRIYMDSVQTGNGQRMWFHKMGDGKYPIIEHSYEAEDFDTTPGSGTWTTPSGSVSGGNLARYTGDAGHSGHLTMEVVDNFNPFSRYVRSFFAVPRKIYARCRCSDVSEAEIHAEIDTTASTVVNKTKTLSADNTWEWIDLGPLDVLLSDSGNKTFVPIKLEFHVDITGGSGITFDIDKVEFLPTGDDSIMLAEIPTIVQGEYYLADGFNGDFVQGTVGVRLPREGSCWTIEPGNVMTRIVVGWSDKSNAHTVTDNIRVRAFVYPRTTGLLGTI